MKRTLTCLSGLIIGSAVALAVPPGWTWGAANCGYPNTISSDGCKLCCRDGLLNGHIDITEWNGCRQFCDDHTFPSFPGVRRVWEWLIIKIV